MPADFRVSITNADGDAAYPIASFTWLLLYQDPKDKAQAKVDRRIHEVGPHRTDRSSRRSMGYAPLPKAVVDLELKSLATIKTQ